MMGNAVEYQPTLTPFQLELLSNIFRILVKEIKTDEDKELLAPGEMGINYKEGSFYIRNPHTGELFTPNSLGYLNQILSKYTPETNILNADRVAGIRFYSNISQLTQLGISLSADSIIRQMEWPGILMSPVEYENFTALQMPSDSGLMLVYKASPEFVMASFYDNKTKLTYQGKYNPFTQYFEGWLCNEAPTGFIEPEGNGNWMTIRLDHELTDLEIITLRATYDINPGAKISVNNGVFMPIINNSGNPLDTMITANNIIMLIYDETRKSWILANSNETSTNSILTVLKERVETATADITMATKDYRERLEQLTKSVNDDIAALKARPGVLDTVISNMTIERNGVDTISAVTGFDAAYDKLIINVGQTVLRPNIDYIIEDAGSIYLKEIRLNTGDQVQFIVLKQARPTE